MEVVVANDQLFASSLEILRTIILVVVAYSRSVHF